MRMMIKKYGEKGDNSNDDDDNNNNNNNSSPKVSTHTASHSTGTGFLSLE
jgi:hypothetical protein